MKHNYITRNDGVRNHSWRVWIYVGTEYEQDKSFTDFQYGNKSKSLKAALKFRDDVFYAAPKKIQYAHLRKAQFNVDRKPRLWRQLGRWENSEYTYLFMVCAYNKLTKIKYRKSYSFGRLRSRPEAYRLAILWRRNKLKEIESEIKKNIRLI